MLGGDKVYPFAEAGLFLTEPMKTEAVLEFLNRPSTNTAIRPLATNSPLFRFLVKCEESPALAARIHKMSQRHVETALRLGGFPASFVPVAWGRVFKATTEGLGLDLDTGKAGYFFIHKSGIAEGPKLKGRFVHTGFLAQLMRDACPDSLTINQEGLCDYLESVEQVGRE